MDTGGGEYIVASGRQQPPDAREQAAGAALRDGHAGGGRRGCSR